jgi:ubiquinone/menaquinone biosynthesis C-methylase UbiE
LNPLTNSTAPGPTSGTAQDETAYLLGHSALEHRRLLIQSSFLRPWTTRCLRAAGVTQGMSVLDIGSGLGDVAHIAAEIVGPGGRVVGVERDPTAVEMARRRTQSEGYSEYVSFETAALDEFETTERFDALVGRFVLIFQADPAAVLRRLSSFVRPGGVVVMHEMDFAATDVSQPACPLMNDCYALLAELFKTRGLAPDFGRRLTRTLLDAGLPWPDIDMVGTPGGKPGSTVFHWLGSALLAVAPLLDQAGIELPEGVVIDESLTGRLEQAALAQRSQVQGPTLYGAWTRLPL